MKNTGRVKRMTAGGLLAMLSALAGAAESPGGVPTLIQRLKDRDPSIQREAANALRALQDPQAMPELLKALKDPHAGVRMTVAQTIGRMANAEVRGEWKKIYKKPHPLFPLMLQILKALVEAVQDKDWQVSQHAADALYAINDPQAIPFLIKAFDHPETAVRQLVVKLLGTMHGLSGHLLTKAQSDPDPIISQIAEAVAARLQQESDEEMRRMMSREEEPEPIEPDPERVAGLIELLKQGELEHRRIAAEDLMSINAPAVVPALIEALHDTDQGVRLMAVWALGQKNDPAAEPALLNLVNDPSAEIRAVALNSLGTLNPNAALTLAFQGFKDTDSNVRKAALTILGRSETVHPKIFPAVSAALEDSNPGVRQTAAETLGLLKNIKGIPILNKASEDADPGVRQAAILALGGLAPNAIPVLTTLLVRKETDVKRAAAAALGSTHQRAAVAPLVKALSDADPTVRQAVVSALSRIPDAQAAIGLVQALQDVDPTVQEWALQYLMVVRKNPESAAAAPAVIKAMKGVDSRTRHTLAMVLGKLNHPAALTALIDALGDNAVGMTQEQIIKRGFNMYDEETWPGLGNAEGDVLETVRQAAVKGIILRGPHTSQAGPALANALKHKNPGVRKAAAVALGYVGDSDTVLALGAAVKDPDPVCANGNCIPWIVRQSLKYMPPSSSPLNSSGRSHSYVTSRTQSSIGGESSETSMIKTLKGGLDSSPHLDGGRGQQEGIIEVGMIKGAFSNTSVPVSPHAA